MIASDMISMDHDGEDLQIDRWINTLLSRLIYVYDCKYELWWWYDDDDDVAGGGNYDGSNDKDEVNNVNLQ